MTQFPNNFDTFQNPAANTPMDAGPGLYHDEQHANANDAIRALQEKVGVNNSAVATSLDYRLKQVEQSGVSSVAGKTGAVTLTADDVGETAEKKWWNNGSTIASTLTGLAAANQVQALAAADTILQAFAKLEYRVALSDAKSGYSSAAARADAIAAPLAGYTKAGAASTLAAADTVLAAFGKLEYKVDNPTLVDGASVVWGTTSKIVGHTANKYLRFFANSAIVGFTLDASNGTWLVVGPNSAVAPAAQQFRASDGNGTDVAGSDLWLCGGRATGTALGGDVILATSFKSAFSGAATRAATERFRIGSTLVTSSVDVLSKGNLTVGGAVGNKALIIYASSDSDSAPTSYERLSIGNLSAPAAGVLNGTFNLEPQWEGTGKQREIRFVLGGGFNIDFGGIAGSYFPGIFMQSGAGSQTDRGFTRTSKGLACAGKTGLTTFPLRASAFYSVANATTLLDSECPVALTQTGIEFGPGEPDQGRDCSLSRLQAGLLGLNAALALPQVEHAPFIVSQHMGIAEIDFKNALQTLFINDAFMTLSTEGAMLVPGRSTTIRIKNGASNCSLTFPGWTWIGTTPVDILANRTALLTLICFGATDADICATYVVENPS